ncbi:MAG: hypothetical protein IPP77_10655 [Bacteroidetes bacterium]|nr:hypothetical protein [Bacteroidota bacterium]
MLSIFKSNNPLVVLLYFIYLVIFRLYFVSHSPNTESVFLHQEPLSSGLFGLLLRIPIPYLTLSVLLSALLCFIQAIWVNDIVNSNKILSKRNYLPGAIFIVFSSFLPQFLLLDPAAVSFTFLIAATGKIFSIVRKEKANGDIFDIGFLIAIASLFYFPSILFLLFGYIGLATVRAFSYREWTILFLGFIAPFFLVFTFYFWIDDLPILLSLLENNHSINWLNGFHFTQMEWALLGVLGFISMVSYVMLPAAIYSSVIQTRKFALLLLVFTVLSLVSFLLLQYASLTHILWLSLPLAIIISMLIMQVKRVWIYEVIHLILILLVLAGQYLPSLLKTIES